MAEDYKAKARKRAKERQAGFWFKLGVGDNSIRLLPTPESDTTPGVWMEYGLHRDVGPLKKTLRCGKEGDEGRCYICDKYIPKLQAVGKDKRAAALEPDTAMVVQVAIPNDEDALEGPKGWNPSKRVGDRLLGNIIGNKKTEFVDARKGHCINITRNGTGKNDTTYDWGLPDPDPTPISKAMMAKLKPFSELKEIPQYSEAAQKAAIAGRELDKSADDDDADDDQPKKKPAKKRPPVDDDDDDNAPDDDDDDTSSDDDDDPPPKKKPAGKAGKKKPADDDDDDVADDDDDTSADDDDDDPPPKKKPGKNKPADDDDDDDNTADDDDDTSSDDDDDPPPKKKPGKKKPADDDDDDPPARKPGKKKPVDDDDDDVTADDDDDDPPPKKKTGKKKPVEDDDDDVSSDDDDDDNAADDDDDPPPPKRKLPPAKKRR